MITLSVVKNNAINSLFLFLLVSLIMLSCGENKDTTHPTVKPLMEAVYASGYVVSKGEYEVYAQAEGYLIDKRVNDGDEVKAGDVLFVIDADQQSARYRMAKENYAVAKENYGKDSPALSELKVAVEAARTKMEFDSINFKRYSNLIKENAVSQSDYDRARLAYENSGNDYLLQKSRFEKAQNQLRLELVNAENQLRIAGDESKHYVVRSQVEGMVFKTSKDEGEMIRRGEMVALVGQKDGFYLELQIDELDVNRVKEGQQVLVKIDAYPEKVFHAKVGQVYPLVNKQQQSVRVDAVLQDPLPGWFSGLALEANIIIREKTNALVIPKTVLLPGDSVWIESNGEEKKVKVETGIQTLDEVEILTGLDTGNTLLVTR